MVRESVKLLEEDKTLEVKGLSDVCDGFFFSFLQLLLLLQAATYQDSDATTANFILTTIPVHIRIGALIFRYKSANTVQIGQHDFEFVSYSGTSLSLCWFRSNVDFWFMCLGVESAVVFTCYRYCLGCVLLCATFVSKCCKSVEHRQRIHVFELASIVTRIWEIVALCRGVIHGVWFNFWAFSYSGLVGDAFGGAGRNLLQACIVINNLGTLVVYMIIIGDVLSGTWSDGIHYSGVMEEWFGQQWWDKRSVLLLLTTILVFAPLISFKHLVLRLKSPTRPNNTMQWLLVLRWGEDNYSNHLTRMKIMKISKREFGSIIAKLLVVFIVFMVKVSDWIFWIAVEPMNMVLVNSPFQTSLMESPLVCWTSLHNSLRYTSALSVGLAVVFVVITAGVAIVKLRNGSIEMPRLLPELVDQASFWKLFTTVPILVTAYICHHNIHPIENELQDPSQMKSIVRTSITLCLSVYLATSFFGFLLFGNHTLDDVLANFDADLGIPYSSLLNDVVRVSYCIHLMLVFPIIFFSLRLNLDGLLFPYAIPIAFDNRRFFSVTAALMGFIFLGANFVPSIWDAFQFTGATATVSVGFIFPAAVALRDTHAISTKKDRLVSWVMIFTAVSSSTVAISSDIYSIFNGTT
ncbi:hypothetical protein TEA_020200 [Camellia sinensis var. sinensis]|uniref:Amino acid transporter transmembrane domain-containing protein n=1 Tax=Camellia sinensis var. sinensis TaxID=542762 RepID=A0A4S4DMR1_CAMSN|nr:hypothetical protein TEA_020200 [Camellia sinensis var. sinensis]